MRAALVSTALVLTVVLAGCGGGASQPETVTSRDDVQAFVQEVVDYAEANGQDAAFQAINDRQGPFTRGELYIFAYDFDGNVVAHGGNAELIGQNIAGMDDGYGNELLAQFLAAVEKGGGWVEYLWPDPADENKRKRKWGYVAAVDDTWWVGAGTYEK
ncbi:MAG: cache domain-containing protein [bacterium]